MSRIVRSHTAGSPVEPGSLWTNRSLREIAAELADDGLRACLNTVSSILRTTLGLGRRQAAKDTPLARSPDRDAQFRIIDDVKEYYLRWDLPVLCIDTKKKELLGDFHRPGQAWTDGRVEALDHDFASAAVGKAIPYGVYDFGANEGLMYLATGSDTGELVGDALRAWWRRLGRFRYGEPRRILILADCGGSNGYRVPLFREHLWRFSRWYGRPVRVAHLPPYCSKYNPIDHRMFCHVTRSLSGLLLRNMDTVAEAIRRTTTRTGLRVAVEIARKTYERGVKVSADFTNSLIHRFNDLPDYNYVTRATG